MRSGGSCRGGGCVQGHQQRPSDTRMALGGPSECRTGVPDFNHGRERTFARITIKIAKGIIALELSQGSSESVSKRLHKAKAYKYIKNLF